MIAKDGRLAILDWGQTQVAPEAYRHHLCRLVVSMVAEDYPKIAEEVRLHSQVQLERPTTEALAALCYAYFDTRPTPLAEVNMMDLNNSPFLQNRITQNTQEGFFTIRSVFLLRGMMATCGVTASMVEAWEEDARAVLRASGDRTVPSVISSRSRRMLTRTWLGLQKSLNVGAGARLNTLEAYTATGATMDDGGVGSGRASPQDSRRMSSLW
jgi:aarF domain-containing kinase